MCQEFGFEVLGVSGFQDLEETGNRNMDSVEETSMAKRWVARSMIASGTLFRYVGRKLQPPGMLVHCVAYCLTGARRGRKPERIC